jgi:hypothetical protein
MKRDHLDDAIDSVAARMTRVEENDALAIRISSSLPDRRVGLGWIFAGWAPRLAVLALGALAITVVLRTFDDGSTGVLRTESASVPFVEFRAAVERPAVEPEPIVRRTPVEPSSNDRRTTEDFDRSLEALVAPAALALGTLAPSDLPVQGSLVLEPLAIADLPLTAEIISPR